VLLMFVSGTLDYRYQFMADSGLAFFGLAVALR